MLAQAATRGQQSAALPSSPSPEPGNASSQVGGISGEGDRKARLEGAVGTGEEAELGVSQEPAEKQSEELLFLSSHPTIHLFIQSWEVRGQATQCLLGQGNTFEVCPEGIVEPWTWSEQGRSWICRSGEVGEESGDSRDTGSQGL